MTDAWQGMELFWFATSLLLNKFFMFVLTLNIQYLNLQLFLLCVKTDLVPNRCHVPCRSEILVHPRPVVVNQHH